MVLKALPAEEVEANIHTLHAMIADNPLQVEALYGLMTHRIPQKTSVTNKAVNLLAKYGNKALLSEIFEAEDFDFKWDVVDLKPAMVELYSRWIDIEEFSTRPDNLLIPSSNGDWEQRFAEALAKVLLERGAVMTYHDSIYSWQDNSAKVLYKDLEIVAIFSARSDQWSEFGDTMRGNDEYHGITAEVLYSNGHFRNLRYRTEDLGEIIRTL